MRIRLIPVGARGFLDEMIVSDLQDYPDRLVDLPHDPWAWSDFDPGDHGPGRYAVLLSLWTATQSPGHLTMEAHVDDRGVGGVGGVHVEVIGAHVM